MLLKTKLLLSLGTLGVVAGTSSGVYYLKNKDVSSEEDTKAPKGQAAAQQGLSATPGVGSNSGSNSGGTGLSGAGGTTAQVTQPPSPS